MENAVDWTVKVRCYHFQVKMNEYFFVAQLLEVPSELRLMVVQSFRCTKNLILVCQVVANVG